MTGKNIWKVDELTSHRDREIVQKVEALMELTTQDGRIHKPCQSEKLLTLSPPKLSSL